MAQEKASWGSAAIVQAHCMCQTVAWQGSATAVDCGLLGSGPSRIILACGDMLVLGHEGVLNGRNNHAGHLGHGGRPFSMAQASVQGLMCGGGL